MGPIMKSFLQKAGVLMAAVALLGAAAVVAWASPAPLSTGAQIAIVSCVLLGVFDRALASATAADLAVALGAAARTNRAPDGQPGGKKYLKGSAGKAPAGF